MRELAESSVGGAPGSENRVLCVMGDRPPVECQRTMIVPWVSKVVL